MFITFESTREGLGKTTQALSLQTKLKADGYEVIYTKEPGGTDLGQHIRQLLLYGKDQHIDPMAELLLFNADRAQHVHTVIKPALERGAIVLCDRYLDSSIAYQGYARGYDLLTLYKLHDIATNGLFPDITFVFEGTSFKELEKEDRFESEKSTFHQKVREGMLAQAKKDPARYIMINANKEQETLTQHLYNVIRGKIEDVNKNF